MRDYLTIPAIPDSVWKNPLHFIAFGFGVGCIPFAPGTFATLFTIPLYLALSHFSPYAYLVLTILICATSVFICHKVSVEIKINDHQGMCLDEVVGFLVTMCFAPKGIAWICLGVIFFRFFDIAKPWPINYIDRNFHGGLGMILDDVIAGVFSCLLIQLIFRIFS